MRRFLTALVKEIMVPFSKQIMAENNKEFINSQSSQLEEEDLQKLKADDCMPENTKKQTSWGLKKFIQWLEKQKISCDRRTVSSPEHPGLKS